MTRHGFFCTQRISGALMTSPVLCVRLYWQHYTDGHLAPGLLISQSVILKSSAEHTAPVICQCSGTAERQNVDQACHQHFNNVSIKPSPIFPFNDFLEVTLLDNDLENAMLSKRQACLSSTLSFGENRLLGLFQFAKIMLNCSSLCWTSTWCESKVVPSAFQLISFYWLCNAESSSCYRLLDQNFLICQWHVDNKDRNGREVE